MKLPKGVFYNPRQKCLIAKDKPAVIQIQTGGSYSDNDEYRINARTFGQAVAPYLHGDWADFDKLFHLNPQGVIYSGAEHHPTKLTVPKLPNITVVPNFSTTESRGLERPLTVFGCTMGHYHRPETPQGYRIQEVYEFQSYGMLVLDREAGEVEMWVAQDGDKVAVPNGCHMTLYNLGDEDNPLVTLDFANPNRNPSDKDLVKQYGPILLAYYNDFEVIFTLNRLYINNLNHKAGVRLTSPPVEDRDRQIRIVRGSRLDLGQFLYEQLTQNPDVIGRFAKLGISIKRASQEAVLEPLPSGQGVRLYFSRPLVEAAKPGTEVYQYFFPDVEEAKPSPSQGKSIATEESRKTTNKESLIQLKQTNKLTIVVEGAGDWVEQCYRPLFLGKVKRGANLSVYYADDTRWKGRPQWANRNGLQAREIYLDKANPDDFSRYQALIPDVVFIVTPDFTHSAIARRWLNKAPLIFVEKPFDSQLSNVNMLLLEMGRRQPLKTAILGLDHYQFYALPLHELLPEIEQHLGGALAKVVFYMTEVRPIELGRERSLQYGLTLDMLPHMLALLTYFGDVGTIDEIRVIEAGQYDPLVSADKHDLTKQKDLSGVFRNETYSRVKFTFEDYSGSDYRVPCLAIIGKGFSQEAKYLEVTGRNGNAIRVDLNRKPDPDPVPSYPWDSVFFLQRHQGQPPSGAQVRQVQDPYNPKRTLYILEDPSKPDRFHRPLERKRYEKLLDDLLNGTRTAVASALLLTEAYDIVWALDRIWEAVQDWKNTQPAGEWFRYDLQKLNPIRPEDP
jgi:predicted dehydrogenase